MKVMHLADLHLGKCVLEQSMIEDQRYILKQIVGLVVEAKVNVVMVSGDVYDKSVPTIEAVMLFNDFLADLYKLKVKVLVIAGNHDSKDRLSFGNELFCDNDVYIEGVFRGKLKKVSFEDEFGTINFYLFPFVKPVDVRGYFSGREISSYDDAVRCVVDSTKIDVSERNIILVHQFVIACDVMIDKSDLEMVSLGGIDSVDVGIFDKFDYVAMGHLHGGQKIIRDTVRYAGSPLKYSFSEVNQKKSVPIIDFGKKGDVNVELISLCPIRDMRIIRGPIDKLLDKEVYSLGNCDDYVCAVITNDDYVIDAFGKLRRVYKNILKLEYDNKRSLSSREVSDEEKVDFSSLSPLELFNNFYYNQNNIYLDSERLELLKGIINDVLDLEK